MRPPALMMTPRRRMTPDESGSIAQLDFDWEARPVINLELAVVQPEIRGQVAARDLAWGPPQRVLRHLLGSSAAGDLTAQVSGRRTREQHPPQHGAEWGGGDRGPGTGGQVLNHGVGLLSREASLLDREGRGVSSRVNIFDAGHPAVQVDGYESVRIMGKARNRRT